MVTKRKPRERLSYQTTEDLRTKERKHTWDVGSRRRLLLINGASATIVAWKWGRRQERPMCGCVLIGLQPVLGSQSLTDMEEVESLPQGWPEFLLLPPSSLRGNGHSGGGGKIAKNSHGLWDLLFSRNQWN